MQKSHRYQIVEPVPPSSMGIYPDGVPYRGINRIGGEYMDDWDGWQGPWQYFIPDKTQLAAELTYYAEKGFNAIRFPISWERLQHTLRGSLDASYKKQVIDFVTQATVAGWLVIIDLHNYNRYAIDAFDAAGNETPDGMFTIHTYGDADGALAIGDLVDVWTKLAKLFLANSSVAFGLMNEPHDFPVRSDVWFSDLQKVIDAIRGTGATQLILVPNSRGSDVKHWTEYAPNGGPLDSDAAKVIKDHNYAFDMHAYHSHFDPDDHGDPPTKLNPRTYAQELEVVTKWARNNGRRLFLSECGVDKNYPAEGPKAIDNLLSYLNKYADVWLGWTPWDDADPKPEKQYTLTLIDEATGNRIDGPEMSWYAVGQKYLKPNTV